MIKNICENQRGCPGCQLKNLSYEQQLSFKMRLVIKLMGRFHHVEEIIPSPDRYYYRNKVQYICSVKNGRPVWGMYSGASDRIIPHGGCMIENRSASSAADAACRAALKHGVEFYNGKRGFLRHVTVRQSGTGDLMLIYVTSPDIPESAASGLKKAAEELVKNIPELKTAVRCINSSDTPIYISRQAEILAGEGYIDDQVCSRYFRLAPLSFRQVNSAAADILCNTAAEFCSVRYDRPDPDTGNEDESSIEDMTVFDAYCGTGVMGLCAASGAKKLIGADTSVSAIEDARKSAEICGVNAEYYSADAAEILEQMNLNGTVPDCVIADPPRAGLSKRFISALLKSKPQRIVYISCEPETLARDAAMLCRRGYRVKRIQPVDMFPHTKHVETVVLLSLKHAER